MYTVLLLSKKVIVIDKLDVVLSIYHKKTCTSNYKILFYIRATWCDGVRCIYKCSQCAVYSRLFGMLYNPQLQTVQKHSMYSMVIVHLAALYSTNR